MANVAGEVNGGYGGAMPRQDPERERRLAEALRVNLRRRKARGRDETEGGAGVPPPADGAGPE